MTKPCTNPIPGTDRICGDEVDGPFQTRYCSKECAKRAGKAELEDLGITPEMMQEALDGYYECKEMIESRQKEAPPAPRSSHPYEYYPPQQGPS